MPIPAAPWDRLFADIKSVIPGAIDAVIRQELWRAVEDFLYETNAWIEEIPVIILPDITAYVVTPTSNSSLERLMIVYDPQHPYGARNWVHSGISFSPPDTIHLAHSPSTETLWMAVFSKNIADPPDASGYPIFPASAEWIVDRYRDAFRYCTLAYLFMQPAKPYSNPKLAAVNSQEYVSLRARARTEINHANVYNGQRWSFPQDYATSSRKGWT